MIDRRDTHTSHEPSAEQVAREVFGHDVGTLISSDPIARRGVDPEGVHRMRVASRHLRSELRLLAPVLRGKAIEPLRTELRWLTGALGAARDADVRSERSAGLLATIPDASPAAVALRQSDRTARLHAHDALITTLASKRYRTLIEKLSRLAIDPPLTKLGVVPARGIVTPGLRTMAARLDDLVVSLGPSPTTKALHGVRIAAKRLRYGATVAMLFAGAEADLAAECLGELQDLLGEGRDAQMSIERLRHLGAGADPFEPTSREGGEVASMIEIERARIAQADERWPSAYSHARAHLVTLGWLATE